MGDNLYEVGTVKIYYPLRGYGFITREKGRDVFFYRTDIGDEVWALEGVRVQFTIEKSGTRLRARSIQKIG